MIGVFGGTFDPIHFGHLRPALEILESLDLEQVRLIPLNVAVHRPQPLASASSRMEMLRAAVADEPRLVADGRELGRAGRSYTFDTLVSLRAELDRRCPICLLIGADAFGGFLGWHRPREILELAHLVVMRRPGHEASAEAGLRDLYASVGADDAADLARAAGGRILMRDVTQLEISATTIRSLVRSGRSARYLVPDAVLALIGAKGLYRA